MSSSRSSCYTSSKAATSTKLAKHTGNQDALERLKERHEKASASSSKFAHSIQRAMKSLRECPTQISTLQDALALKYVGPTLAKVMVPNETIQRSSPISQRPLLTQSRKQNKPWRQLLPPTAPSFACIKSIKSIKQSNYEAAVAAATSLALPTKNWKVTLLLDGREQRAEHVQAKLQMSGVPCEQRHLPIGDMAWIATSGETQVMLGTIVERKQVDDLASSLFGTRYLEQRLRLQHCGVPQVMLLVEGDLNAVTNCPADTLKMAMMETRVQLGFQVHQTKHLDDTVRFLKLVHRRILQRAFPSAFGDSSATCLPSFSCQPRPLKRKKVSLEELVFDTAPVPPLNQTRFITYEELKAKVLLDREQGTRTVRAVYCGMLKQIPSLSHKKVLAIAQAYPTPNALFQAYQGVNEEEGKVLLADLDTAVDNAMERVCRVGSKSSMEVYNVFTQGESIATKHSSVVTNTEPNPVHTSLGQNIALPKEPAKKKKIDPSIPDFGIFSPDSSHEGEKIGANQRVVFETKPESRPVACPILDMNSDSSPSTSVDIRFDLSYEKLAGAKAKFSTRVRDSIDSDDYVDLTWGDDGDPLTSNSLRVSAAEFQRDLVNASELESQEQSQSSGDEDETLLERLKRRQQQSPSRRNRDASMADATCRKFASSSSREVIELLN